MEPVEVLFLAHRAPFPPDKGDRLRAWRHIERLAQLGPVDVVAQADDDESAERAREGLRQVCREVVVHTRRRPAALAHVGGALLGGSSLTAGWHTDGRIERDLEALQQRHDHDLVWAFSSGTGPWWRRCRAPRRIFDLCDLDALKWEALGKAGQGPRGWVYRVEARRLLPLELALAVDADLSLVSTQQEADDLTSRCAPRHLEILTNGVPWEQSAGLAPPSAAPPVIGFLGQMDYPPNVEAATHLAREVLPRVRATVPDARLSIMGRAPTAAVRALARAGEVEVTGAIDAVPPALERVAVFVAPLDGGRGIPNKILEAMAAARPTVVSSWSARALVGEPGRDYLVCDGAADRARTVTDLLNDGGRRDALGQAGQTYVRRHHDWEVVLDRLEALVHQTLAGAPTRA